MKIQSLLNMLLIFLYWMQNASFISKKWLTSPLSFPFLFLNLILLFHLEDLQITKRVPHFWCTMTAFLKWCNFSFVLFCIDNSIIWCMMTNTECVFLSLFLWLFFVGIYSSLVSMLLYISKIVSIKTKGAVKQTRTLICADWAQVGYSLTSWNIWNVKVRYWSMETSL